MIRITVKFFGPFRDLFGGRERMIESDSELKLGQLLERLCDTPEKNKQVFQGGEMPPSHIVIVKNGMPVHGADRRETLLRDGDVVAVFPFLGGG